MGGRKGRKEGRKDLNGEMSGGIVVVFAGGGVVLDVVVVAGGMQLYANF